MNLFKTPEFWLNLLAVIVEIAQATITEKLFGGRIPLEYLMAIVVVGNVILRAYRQKKETEEEIKKGMLIYTLNETVKQMGPECRGKLYKRYYEREEKNV